MHVVAFLFIRIFPQAVFHNTLYLTRILSFFLSDSHALIPQGLMSYEDFKRVFQGSEDEMESRMGGAEGSSNFVTIPPKPIPELSELLNTVSV